jgi:hypothetical protein
MERGKVNISVHLRGADVSLVLNRGRIGVEEIGMPN